MAEFNHLAVLISIVLGLGIAQLLSGFGRQLEQRQTFRAYRPSVIWATALLAIHVQSWWAMFGMRDHEAWTFVQFALVLLQPIILYLLTTLVIPSQTAPEQDLKRNYWAQRKWFFGMLAALLVVSVMKDVALDRMLPEPVNLGFHVFLFVAACGAIASENERYHHALAYSSVVFCTAYISLLFAQLA